MRRFSISFAALIFACAAVTQAADSPTIVMPSQLKWSGAGLPAGIWMATVAGNPNGTGVYVVRIKMNSGAKFPPHTHGKTERVTVLQGTLMAGIGSKWDASKMMALPAGTYVIMPAGVPHYVMAKGIVVIQVSGQGPSTTNMLGGGHMSM